jgi:hypothetical protein
MKKIFTFCFFAFALLMGTQSIQAQNKAEINESALVKAKEIRSLVKFDDNTLGKVFVAYQAYENKLHSLEKYQTPGSIEYKDALLKLNKNLQANVKKALGGELYKSYLEVRTQ